MQDKRAKGTGRVRVSGDNEARTGKRKGDRGSVPESNHTSNALTQAYMAHDAIRASMAMALIERVNLINKGKFDIRDVKSEWILLGLYYFLSYAYYIRDDSLVSDDDYDLLCKVCYKRSKSEVAVPELKAHRFDFKAGTGFGLKYDEFRHPPAEYTYFLYKSLLFMKNMPKPDGESLKNTGEKPKKRVKSGGTYSEKGHKKQGRLFK